MNQDLGDHKTDHTNELAIANLAIQIGIYSCFNSNRYNSWIIAAVSYLVVWLLLGQHIRGTILGYDLANPYS
nr:hypothetical protein [Vibrio sp. 99-70-13A1]